MINSLIIGTTHLVSAALCRLHLDRPIRAVEDGRLVHYHGIGDQRSPCMRHLQDEIPRDRFERQIDYLAARYDMVSLDELTDRMLEPGTHQRAPCSITFDDGLASVHSQALPVLERRGIPFSVFLNTDSVDNSNLLWLHLLGYLISTLGEPRLVQAINAQREIDLPALPATSTAADIEHWGRRHAGHLYRQSVFRRIAADHDIDPQTIARQERLYLSWKQIEDMSRRGASFYSHTHSHYPLQTLDDDAVSAEIIRASEVLAGRAVTDQTFISFPFGMRSCYGNKAPEVALATGHRYLVEVGDGLNSRQRLTEEHILARVGLGTTDASAAALHAAMELRPVVKHTLRRLLTTLSPRVATTP